MVRISVDVSDDVAEELTRLAQHLGSTPEAILARWVADAVSERDELARRLERGLAELEAGETFDHEEVMAELEAWAADVEARHRPQQ